MNEPAPSRRADRRFCAIVTGAADGVGAMLAGALASRGINVIAADRDEIALARVRQDINAEAIRCDVLDEASVRSLFEAAEASFGHIDLLVNAAGSGYVRTLGVMRGSREFARRARDQRAYIVNLAAEPDPGSERFEYAGSQLAFTRLAEGLARAIECPDLAVLTFDRIADEAVITDLAEQLVAQLTSGPALGNASGIGSAA